VLKGIKQEADLLGVASALATMNLNHNNAAPGHIRIVEVVRPYPRGAEEGAG
jgi:hypothetical protein